MKKIVALIYGLLGLSFVVMIHELGHFLAAKWCGVAVPLFSIGFGPGLVGLKMGGTLFQIALFPIGGYVVIAAKELAQQPYLIKLFIVSAGIVINILFAYLIIWILRVQHIDVRACMNEMAQLSDAPMMGPIGIIAMARYSAMLGFRYYVVMLAGLSMGIGLFNLLPIPFFDGGQIAWYTIEAIFGNIPEAVVSFGSTIFIILFLIILFWVSMRDIQRW